MALCRIRGPLASQADTLSLSCDSGFIRRSSYNSAGNPLQLRNDPQRFRQIPDRVKRGLRGSGLVALNLRDPHPNQLRKALLRDVPLFPQGCEPLREIDLLRCVRDGPHEDDHRAIQLSPGRRGGEKTSGPRVRNG